MVTEDSRIATRKRLLTSPHSLLFSSAGSSTAAVRSGWVHCHATESRGAHLTLRAGGEKKTVPLPSVQQVQPYLPVLSTFSTAGKAKPLPSRTFCYVLTAAEHADKLQRRL